MIDLAITLRPDERLIRRFSISQRLVWTLIGFGIFLALFIPIFGMWLLPFLDFELTPGLVFSLILAGIFVGLGMVLYALYFRAARFYVLTNQRFLETIGFISKRTISADYEQITDIRVYQDGFERLFLGTGLLAINTAGGDVEEIRLERVNQPYGLSNEIRQLCEARLREVGRGEPGTLPPVRTGVRPAGANVQAEQLPPLDLPKQ